MSSNENNNESGGCGGCFGFILFMVIIGFLFSSCGEDKSANNSSKRESNQATQSVETEKDSYERADNNEKRNPVTLNIYYDGKLFGTNMKVDVYIDGNKILEDIEPARDPYEYVIDLTEGNHKVCCKQEKLKVSDEVSFEVDPGNVNFCFDITSQYDNRVKLENINPVSGEFCFWCENAMGRGYLTSQGKYSYVCDKCVKSCMYCDEAVATRHFTNQGQLGPYEGEEFFVCNECYRKLCN